MKVVEIIEAKNAYDWSPEEIHLNHRYLTMSQILCALAYYWDFKSELDVEIQQREEAIKQVERQVGESPFTARLRREGYR